MKILTQHSYNYITIAKLACLALLFSPFWGFWWFKFDADAHWIFSDLIELLKKQKISAFIVYASICLLAFVSFVFIPFIRSPAIRISLMVIMLVGWAFELLILDVSGTPFSHDIFWVLWQERASASELAGFLGGTIFFRDLTSVMILGVVLCASPAPRFSVSNAFGLLPIVAGALVASVVMHTKGGLNNFPIPFGTYSKVATVALIGNKIYSDYKTTLDNFAFKYEGGGVVVHKDRKTEETIRPNFNKIVVIMDESVRGDFILNNDATYNTTPYLNAAGHLINFGVAISGSNCSTVARMMFRFGMRRSDLPKGWQEGLKKPTFWQFAQRAGYKTVFLDAWGNNPLDLHSGFSLAEKSLIDSTINIVESPAYLRDHKLVDKLLDALKEEAPTLIYVDKYGVHFPYWNKYPSALQKPPSPATEFAELETMVRHYRNAILWSVDEFFRKLLPAVDLSKTLIVYTSDHGTSLRVGHSHCTSTPNNVQPTEAYVPIFAVTSQPKFHQLLAESAARSFGRFSHFEIFPTLLLAMGFDASWVKYNYGSSLIDSPAPRREFLIGSPLYQPMMIPADRNLD